MDSDISKTLQERAQQSQFAPRAPQSETITTDFTSGTAETSVVPGSAPEPPLAPQSFETTDDGRTVTSSEGDGVQMASFFNRPFRFFGGR